MFIVAFNQSKHHHTVEPDYCKLYNNTLEHMLAQIHCCNGGFRSVCTRVDNNNYFLLSIN